MTNEELTLQVVDLEKAVAGQQEQIKTAFNQISEVRQLTSGLHKLTTAVELLAQGQTNIGTKVDNLTRDVDEIKNRPAKKWDSASSVIITAIITAVVTYVLTQIGLK